jgi:hypothetical protein
MLCQHSCLVLVTHHDELSVCSWRGVGMLWGWGEGGQGVWQLCVVSVSLAGVSISVRRGRPGSLLNARHHWRRSVWLLASITGHDVVGARAGRAMYGYMSLAVLPAAAGGKDIVSLGWPGCLMCRAAEAWPHWQ